MKTNKTEEDMKYQSSSKDQIEEKLEKIRFRHNLFKCENTYLTLLTIGLAIALITLIVQKFIYVPSYVYVILASLFSVYFFISLITSIKHWTGKAEAASLLDNKMHFKERLVTGLEYAGQKEKNKLFNILVDDITNKLDNKNIKTTLPHKYPKVTKFFIPISILLLILLLLPYIYPEKSEQIVTNIKESVIKAPGVINNSLRKFSKTETKEKNENVVKKKDKLKREEETKKLQQEQENKKLAETKTEKSKKEQEKTEQKQLHAQSPKASEKEQQEQKVTNPLKNEISKLLSKINSTLNKLENRGKSEETTKDEKSKLSGTETLKSQNKEEESQQIAKTNKQQSEAKEKEPTKTAQAPTSTKEASEQKPTEGQEEKQQPKIPESKLLQKLAQNIMSQKDLEKYSQQNFPLGGNEQGQSSSSISGGLSPGTETGSEQKSTGSETSTEQNVAGKVQGQEQKGTGTGSGTEQKGTGKKSGEEQKGAGKKPGQEQKGAGTGSGTQQKGTGKESGEEQKVAGKEPGNEQKGAGKESGEEQKVAGKKPGNEQKGAGTGSGTQQKGTGKKSGEEQKVAGKEPGKEQKGTGTESGTELKLAHKGSGNPGGLSQKRTTGTEGMARGNNKMQGVAELKNQIKNQMESLSSQISNLEKKMGFDISENLEKELKNISQPRLESTKRNEQNKSNEPQESISGVITKGGSERGKELYSSEPEKIETPENAEALKLKVKGFKDESGAKRETISTGKGTASTKRRLPLVNYDNAVKLSTQQAEDEALRKTSIPLEYEEIIKKIHSEKE